MIASSEVDTMPANTMQAKQVHDATKTMLRHLVKTGLKMLEPKSTHEQSPIVAEVLTNQAFYNAAKRVSIYLSMPKGEIHTKDIVLQLLKDNKQVFVPYLRKSSKADRGPDGYLPELCMDMLRIRDWKDYQGLQTDKWGIPSIPYTQELTRESVLRGKDRVFQGLDLMLMPGVAFQVGHAGEVRRLGHGKGFYDFFLRRLRAQVVARERAKGQVSSEGGAEGWPKLVGLALREQMLEFEEEDGDEGLELPMDENDQVLDTVIVGDGRILGVKESSWAQKFPEFRRDDGEAAGGFKSAHDKPRGM